MPTELRNRRTAVALAWIGAVTPLTGLHKFYLGQPVWGVVYLVLGFTPMMLIPRIASAIEGGWLLTQSPDKFASRWSPEISGESSFDPEVVSSLGSALRELDTLRQEGLISEMEFEQKRRQLLEKVG
jgi:TM2 domain-containing membrane protein YozV